MYQQLPDQLGQPAQSIKRLSDNASIPQDPANVDYQAYLAWVEAGNTPLPPDDQTGQNTPIQE
jgi:hypothetical protein